MKVSVVMTTYNGSRFIKKQLDSLRDQTRQADEVIIADDRSTDGTFELVGSYIKENGLVSWKTYQNKVNLGVINNFFFAMKHISGDLLFLSDQDDVWELSKIKELTDIISQHDDMLVLMSKENRIDEKDEFIQYTEKETAQIRLIDLAEEVRECLGAGHLLAMKREFVEQYADSLHNAGMTFDVPFCIVAAARSGLFQYDRRLVKRRLHGNNTSGIKQKQFDRIKNYSKYLKGREMRLGYFRYIVENWKDIADDNHSADFAELSKALEILGDSVSGLNMHKMGPLFKEMISRNKYINKSISLANILALSRKKLVSKEE